MNKINTKQQFLKTFDLRKEKPKVLLLGNGLSRAYNASSWDHFLDSINRKKEEFPEPDKNDMPMPMKIILLTDNHVGEAMKDNKEYFLRGFYDELDDGVYDQIRKLFDCDFDYILTTNYSYELEYAVYGDKLTENRIKSIQKYVDVQRAESKYMLHTFNQLEYGDKKIDVWHIHGEARKSDSMIIGSYYYARLTSRIIDAITNMDCERRDDKDINVVSIRNWVEALVYGNIYVLGFGYDYSEQDLWWLLNRKANETKIETGTVYYYEPDTNDHIRIKKSLLNVFGVHTEGLNLGYEGKVTNYKSFYKDAIDDITQRVKQEGI